MQLAPSTSLDEQTLSSLQCWKGVGLRTDEQETNEMTGGTFPLPKLSVCPRREFFYIALSPPPPPARFYARLVLTLWLEKCLIQRQWCGHVAQPDKVWEQQRTETILEEKPQQQFMCLKLSPPHVHGAASVPHTSARTGQALHSAGHKATNIFCSLKPTLISYLYNTAHVFWGILPKNEYVLLKSMNYC